jgi:hypothetical protein
VTTFAFPSSITPNDAEMQLVSNTSARLSVLSRQMQTLVRAGEAWVYTMNFRNLTYEQGAELEAWLFRLNGQEHRFTVQDHRYRALQGVGGGSPLVNGASQTGAALIVDGAPSSISDWLKPGDYIKFGNELKRVTAPVDTSSDDATIPIIPRIRVSPGNNASVLVGPGTTGLFMLAEKEQSGRTRAGGFTDITINCAEAVAGA